jgi:hypothetical protein
MGDFNLIYLGQDKSNGRLNWRMTTRFRRTLNHLEAHEIQLLGKRFTWSNEQRSPTMSRIDRMFRTIPWEELHHDATLQILSSSTSDHCPLLLHAQEHMSRPPIFRLESHWPLMSGFTECIQKAWNQPVGMSQNAMMKLHIKLSRTAKALSAWAHTIIPMGKLAAVICREVIAHLESAQENRTLSEEEGHLKKLLKDRILGLAAIERSRACQQSRLTWLKKG